jgi:hypothetical protein
VRLANPAGRSGPGRVRDEPNHKLYGSSLCSARGLDSESRPVLAITDSTTLLEAKRVRPPSIDP